jgi:hypothetical protein
VNAYDVLPVALGRHHARRLREIHRSAGWPCQDGIELELLAGGLVECLRDEAGRETLRLTALGVQFAAAQMARNRAALSAHEALVARVARDMARAGRIAWQGLSLRAQVALPAASGEGEEAPPARWCIARPDVFSIRNTSVAEYVDPIVHEVKVRRADLLADLKRPEKRAAYLDVGECWYVLGEDAKGRPIADPDEIPAGCGVLLAQGTQLVVARAAARRSRTGLPFGVWMALAKATPLPVAQDDEQAWLRPA